MHSKYEVSITNSSKVMVGVKVDNWQTDTQKDKQTYKQK